MENKSSLKAKKEIAHVLKARIRGKAIASEFTQEKIPEHFVWFYNTANETAILFLILWVLFQKIHLDRFHVLIIASISWLVWKSCRSAYLGWMSLQKLHKVIQEEKWEIEHHRKQEKKELETLYKAKGFHGKILDEVVEILMADDNRLLQIMLEEEMGLALESYEHPLKQGAGAALGVLSSFFLLSFSYFLFPLYGLFIASALILTLCPFFSSKHLRMNATTSIIWNLAIGALIFCISYFSTNILGAFFSK